MSIHTNNPRDYHHGMITNVSAGVQAFTSNAYLVTGERPVMIDTGANFDVVARIHEHTNDLAAIILTHTHSDHIGNVDDITSAFDVDVWGFDPTHDLVDHEITADEQLRFGDHDYTALHTPGHAPDHLCFYSRDVNVLFAGDLVFQNGSFGRTDLDGGDRPTLVESIQFVLETVTEDLEELHTGHGPSVTRNPYEHIELSRRFASQL